MESPDAISDVVTEFSSRSVTPNSFKPINGHLVPLKTKHEVQTLTETVHALVLALPKRLASKAIVTLKPFYPPPQPGQPTFHHLRKFADTSHLPPHLQESFRQQFDSKAASDQVVHFLVLPPVPEDEQALLSAYRKLVDPSFPLVLRSLEVPLYPPVSQEQALANSEKYWPCSYNPAAQTIQNAPSFHTLRRVITELTTRKWHAGHYLALAQQAADEVFYAGWGRRSGAVAADGATGLVVAVAGDGRWLQTSFSDENEEGRPEHHALMRVIAMIAAKERDGRGLPRSRTLNSMDDGQYPVTDIEKQYYGMHNTPIPSDYPGARHALPDGDDIGQLGYLCAGLDIYLTHEPCIMCSMGMVHSRFRACVFSQRMNGTGGLCAEIDRGSIGYGLCWRKELNWRVMAFEYQCKEKSGDVEESFHA